MAWDTLVGVEPLDSVLFMVADQWRVDALGSAGTAGVHTPHLDALASRGVSFRAHSCQGSPCGPARRTMLTGTAVPTHGQWTNDDVADPALPSIAAVARDSGVEPLLIGYTDTPQPGPARGGETLYDPAFELIRPFFWQLHFPTYRSHLTGLGYGPFGDDMMAIYAPEGDPDPEGLSPSPVAASDSDVAWLTDAAVEALDRAGRQLLHVNWLRPHPPFAPVAPYHRLVSPDACEPPERGLTLDEQVAVHPYFAAVAPRRQMAEYLQRRCRLEDVTDHDDRVLRAAYYGHCAEIDHHIGRLWERLARTGRADRTLVVFLSDHGDALGDHWLYGRTGPFDAHFHVPCIIVDPRPEADAARGSTVDALTANMDVAATLLDVLGLDVPATVEGSSLVPFLHGADPAWRQWRRDDMDWTAQAGGDRGTERFAVVRTPTHRYVEFTGFQPLLFDLTEDPLETVNLADDTGRSSVRDELAALLHTGG